MNILYYGMSGSAANPNLGWPLVIIGAILMIVLPIILGHFCCSDNWIPVVGIIVGLCLIRGTCNVIDNRSPYITAKLDNTVSFTEIQDKYELKKKEGQLYTFKVLDVDIDEWEQLVKEKNN